ncbi:MAG: RNA polymerase sigma factor [Planctomycetes bacterium]|nr:RNA polymerase sigma factor [Planctomycetota bacterium]
MRVPPGWEGLSDEELALRSREEPRIAFEVLFERYRDRVYAFLSRQFADRARADDLFQNVFLKAFRALPRFRMESRFKTWIFTIASNVVTDELRTKGRRGTPVELAETMAMTGPVDPDELDRDERLARVKRAVAALPDGIRQLFTLVRFHGMKIAEAALTVGMTPAAAKVALFRAQRKVGEMVLAKEPV